MSTPNPVPLPPSTQPQGRYPKPGRAIGAGVLAAAIAVAVGLSTKYEPAAVNPGLAYADKLAHGLPTACMGHTGPDVVVGVTYSAAQCAAWETQDLARSVANVNQCIMVPLTAGQAGALIDAAYNLGPSVVCGSTIQREINAGYPATTWCYQLLRWNHAGGRAVRGLTRRRYDDLAACTSPISVRP